MTLNYFHFDHAHPHYMKAITSPVFAFIRAMAIGGCTNNSPELRVKFQTVLWVAEMRAQPKTFSTQEMATQFGMTREGMRQHILRNPMLWKREARSRTEGSTVFVAPWVLAIATDNKELA